MNNLFASWHQRVEDLPVQVDPVELLSLARDGLAEIPELKDVVRLVDLALGEVSAWFAAGIASDDVRSFVSPGATSPVRAR